MGEIPQLEASITRMESMGVKNAMIFDRLAWKKRQLEFLKAKKNRDDFASIESVYNEAVNEMNDYIAFRNKQFKPVVTDAQLKSKINTPKEKLLDCQKRIADFVLYDKQDANASSLESFKKALEQVLEQCNEQEKFVIEYLKKPKISRKMMFYKKI